MSSQTECQTTVVYVRQAPAVFPQMCRVAAAVVVPKTMAFTQGTFARMGEPGLHGSIMQGDGLCVDRGLEGKC